MNQQSSTPKEYLVPYSLENMNTVLNYNFDLYNRLQRNKYTSKVKDQTKYILTKGDVRQSLYFFMPSEIITDTIFKQFHFLFYW